MSESPDQNATAPEGGPQTGVNQLSVDEQASLVIGATAWRTVGFGDKGIREVTLSDGPNGVRNPDPSAQGSLYKSHPTTSFPAAVVLGSTWDPPLVGEIGTALGAEAAELGVDVLLAPGLNLKRSPLGGRNFEYFSEDPLLTSRLGTSLVNGVQSHGVGACVKHFVANDTEDRRYGIDTRVDPRALRELYLAAFEGVFRDARPVAVMAAYNQLNGRHCTEDRWLLHELLRDEWGYTGMVVSDWGAVFDRGPALRAGLDLEMPGPGDAAGLARAVKEDRLSKVNLVESAERIIQLAARPAPHRRKADLQAHQDLARRAAAAGTVLLKNDQGLLPLADSGQTVAVIGSFAVKPRFQGGGSSQIVPTELPTLLDSLRQALGTTSVRYAEGYPRADGAVVSSMINEAVQVAASADIAIVVAGLPEALETEGTDRAHLRLPPGHNALISSVAAANPQTVVVLQNGSPVEMPWRDQVSAILETYLGGQESGGATTEVLLGHAEPGGRLAETFPLTLEDHPISRTDQGTARREYRESLWMGYRYFESAGVEVAYPFGHGLSYTRFEWTPLSVETRGDVLRCTLEVRNVGDRDGSDVVQLYVSPEAGGAKPRPGMELRGFAKVALASGESHSVEIDLDRRSFAIWDEAASDWIVPAGRYAIRAGASSRDLRSGVVVEISPAQPGRQIAGPDWLDQASIGAADDEQSLGLDEPKFDHAAFAEILAAPSYLADRENEHRYTLDTALRDMRDSAAARGLTRLAHTKAVATLGIPEGDPLMPAIKDVVGNINLRMLPTITGGAFKKWQMPHLLRLINASRRRK